MPDFGKYNWENKYTTVVEKYYSDWMMGGGSWFDWKEVGNDDGS